jgi:hypothetical protein
MYTSCNDCEWNKKDKMYWEPSCWQCSIVYRNNFEKRRTLSQSKDKAVNIPRRG